MNMTEFVDRFVRTAQQALEGENVRVIKAYPSALKPTILKFPVVAVGLGGAELCDESIDDHTKSGELSVFADIFIPRSEDSERAVEIFTLICKSLNGFCLSGISVGRVEYDNSTLAYKMKTSFSFNQTLDFGGENSAG